VLVGVWRPRRGEAPDCSAAVRDSSSKRASANCDSMLFLSASSDASERSKLDSAVALVDRGSTWEWETFVDWVRVLNRSSE
jgi:hypothetical protein